MKVRWGMIALGSAAVVAGLAATAVVLWKTGRIQHWAREELIHRVELATGARVTLGRFQINLSPFTVDLSQLTLHGREAAGQPPFVHINRVTVDVDIAALFERKVILGNVTVDQPSVSIEIDRNGHSNVPAPAHRGPSRPWPQQLFSVTIDHLQLNNGVIRVNNRRAPLTADGGRFNFSMEYASTGPGRDLYRGRVSWDRMRVAAQKWLPFASSWSAQFTIGRRGGSLDQFLWKLPRSTVEAHADWPDWSKPDMDLHYRVHLNLRDIRTVLRKPHTPTGIVESTGNLQYAPHAWNLRGYYTAQNISMDFMWFHTAGMRSRGTILAGPKQLDIPDFQAWAMGGEFTGKVRMNVRTLGFTATTQSRGVRLAQILAAVQNKNFPVQTLHWESVVQVDSVTTWRGDFQDMASQGSVQWTPPPQTPAGQIPVSASIQYNYQMTQNAVFSQGEISTPSTRIQLAGTIGGNNSNMKTDLVVNRLSPWDDLINYLRGPNLTPVAVRGRASWQGSVNGPISHPFFTGKVHAWQARYGNLYWDEIQGDAAYSPNGLTLTHMSVRRGHSLANISLYMEFTNWAFLPQNRWNFAAQLANSDTNDLQGLAGTKYAARGLLSGSFHGGGTHAQPQLLGNFHLADFQTEGYQFPSVAGSLKVDPEALSVNNVTATFGQGRLGGNLTYQRASGNVVFDLFGRNLPLKQIDRHQSPELPIEGSLSFQLTGNGPPRAPRGEGTIELAGFRAGKDLVGNLSAQIKSDGKQMQLQLTSSLPEGTMAGGFDLALRDSYPIQGQLTAEGIDIDPFIRAGLHLSALTSPSRVNGKFQFSGMVLRPNTITVAADISSLEFAYETVELKNVGPLRFVYRRSEVTVEQANLKGVDSNFQLKGVVRFNRNQPLDLSVEGALNLRLLGGFIPAVQSQGTAQVDASINGTLARPRIEGQATLKNAAVTYGDLPIGLSSMNGNLIFSSDHVSFSNLTAEAGGGTVVMSGTANFAPGPSRFQYDVHIAATRVRVRWPKGMSWLVDANARMTGNTKGADLGGEVTLRRLLLTSGPDIAALFDMAPRQINVESSSPFLQNLRLDFTVTSGGGSQLDWNGARIETDASVRVRGTWNRPSVLGHVHVLSGQVNFQGNAYRLSRGDLNFANPLVLDPVMNVEATTTIQQYQITVNLTGPISSLRLSYRSDPPLPESDVISLLALGYTGEASQLRTTSQTSQFGATALLSEAVSSEVGGRIARLFGISRFRIEPYQAPAGAATSAAARIAVQQQVTPNLTVTYATNAASNAAQVIQIEYDVTRNISVVALRDINGTFGIDVEFKQHFH